VDYLHTAEKIDHVDFRQIIDDHGQEIWNYAYFLTKRKDLADDVTQDVFIKAYQNFRTFRGESSIKTWLIKITRTTAYDYKHTSFFQKVVLLAAIFPNKKAPSAEQDYFQLKFRDDIWTHVMDLPIKLREVLLLDAAYEMSLNEIATTLELPIGTVKSRLHRARQQVALRLEEEERSMYE
jgi:RNA polymerase sigma-70 factor, ECF subfamily